MGEICPGPNMITFVRYPVKCETVLPVKTSLTWNRYSIPGISDECDSFRKLAATADSLRLTQPKRFALGWA